MKVVNQLVKHFWQRGALKRDEIEYLLEHGFVRADDLPGYQPSSTFADGSVDIFGIERAELPDPLEQIQEELIRRRPERRRSRSEVRTGELGIEDILERLRQDYERRETDLKSVLALGKQFASVETWYQAASELRSVPSEQFHEGLCANLRDGDVLLGDIWQASDPEPFHKLVADSETRGRAVRSFLALLVAKVPEELGKYSWVLTHDEMQSVINLRVLHDRVLASLRSLYCMDRTLLTHALENNSDPVQFWALVVLYNSDRELPPRPGEDPQYGKEYGPVFLPDFETWKQAWTSALRMDRKKVTKLLVGCCQQAYEKSQSSEQLIEVVDFSFVPLMCPVGWHLPQGKSG